MVSRDTVWKSRFALRKSASGLKVKAGLRVGGIDVQHSRTVLKVRAGVRS